MESDVVGVIGLAYEVMKDTIGISWIRAGVFLVLISIIGYFLCKRKQPSTPPPPLPQPEVRILEKLFGSTVYAANFGLRDVREWTRPRESKLRSGSQAVVFKVNSKALKMYVSDFKRLGLDFDDHERIGKFLVIVIYDDKMQTCTDSLLVKYHDLDKQLDDVLASGGDKFILAES